jgi:signal transduction histidine kinase/ligand-binding sensor domain-containing protein
MKPFLSFFLCTCLYAATLAQSNTFQVLNYSTENNMPSNGIQGMQWDEQTGFLWLATEAGFVRFNGADIKTYTKENTPGIEAERTLFCMRNQQQEILMADATGKLFRVENNRIITREKANEHKGGRWSMYRLLTVSDKLYHSKRTTGNGFSPFFMVTNIVPYAGDTALLLRERKLCFATPDSANPVFLQNNHFFDKIFQAQNQIYLANREEQVFRFDRKTGTTVPVTIRIKNTGRQMKINSAYLFWEYGMPGAIYIHNNKVWLLEPDAENGLLADLLFEGLNLTAYIRFVQYSKAMKTLFIGTDSKGLYVVRSVSAKTMKSRTTGMQYRNSYYSQIELENGAVLTNEGVLVADSKVNTNNLPIEGSFNFFTHLTADSVLYYTQAHPNRKANHLNSYNFKTKTHKVFTQFPLRSQTIMTTAANRLFLLNNDGISEVKDDSLHLLFRFPYTEAGLPAYNLLEVAPGKLAVAGCFGLLLFDYNTLRADTLFQKEGYCVRSLWKYKDYLFFGTYGAGYYVLHKGVVHQMPLDKKKYLLYTHCFVPDGEGYCWMSTNRGLFKAAVADMIDAFNNKTDQVYYHYLGKKDGMEMTELNGGCAPCALVMKDQTISFPSMDGLVWVRPREANLILPTGKIYIDEIVINGTRYHPDSIQLKRLPSGINDLVFRLGIPAWANTENMYLEYQLNDTTYWKPVALEPELAITLSNIPAGKHVMRIRKKNGFGQQNYETITIGFAISIPWYLQWWFYLLGIVFLFGTTILLFELRTLQLTKNQKRLERLVAEKTKELQLQNTLLEKNDTIKTRLISIISHDIITPLKFLAVAGRKLVEKKKEMPAELADETLKEMTNTAQELQFLSTNILNWIKYQNKNRRLLKETVQPSVLVNQVFGVLLSVAHEKKLQLRNDVNPELTLHQFEEPLRILIYNLVSNAIHFSEKGTIVVRSIETDNHLQLQVADEGSGMSVEQVTNLLSDETVISSVNTDHRKGNGLGYLIIKDVLKMMGADLQIESSKGVGTTVSVLFVKESV